MQTGAQRIEAALAHMVATGAQAASVAGAACGVWRGVTAALSPIIGRHGVAALFNRSLHLTRTEHPVLSAVHDAAGGLSDYSALQEALSSQTSASAAAANSALLGTFHDLLSSLIGAMLTERLLRSALDNPSIDHAAQDPSP